MPNKLTAGKGIRHQPRLCKLQRWGQKKKAGLRPGVQALHLHWHALSWEHEGHLRLAGSSSLAVLAPSSLLSAFISLLLLEFQYGQSRPTSRVLKLGEGRFNRTFLILPIRDGFQMCYRDVPK